MQEARQHQRKPWQLEIHANAKHFRFKMIATTSVPDFKLHQFSLLLNISNCCFKINSESRSSPTSQKIRTLKSKFLRIFRKFRSNPAKNQRFQENRSRCVAFCFLLFMAMFACSVGFKLQKSVDWNEIRFSEIFRKAWRIAARVALL
ncbi:hypothetical protein Nepgr_030534 [Nepenthes gracilis]|uniref:Transmembrane protein n=1 Tax=Nepenthes gracilis TaxID=150966 RepID=A0AAD3TGD8_NEPGR|nr:hypothetical protein Nepgr_030534 [Nepenthes gracilis]